MLLDRKAIRDKTTFFVSLPATVEFVALAWIAYDDSEWVVMTVNLIGSVFVAVTGQLARKEDAPEWLPYPFVAFFLAFLSYLSFFEYQGGIGTAWILAVPPLVFLVLGTRPGLIAVILMLPALVYSFVLGNMDDIVVYEYRMRLLVTYGLIASVCFAYSASVDWYDSRLTETSEQLDSLQKLVPMCAHCKQVRVEGDWFQIEEYISKQQEVQVSHGICPTCQKIHYEELR